MLTLQLAYLLISLLFLFTSCMANGIQRAFFVQFLVAFSWPLVLAWACLDYITRRISK